MAFIRRSHDPSASSSVERVADACESDGEGLRGGLVRLGVAGRPWWSSVPLDPRRFWRYRRRDDRRVLWRVSRIGHFVQLGRPSHRLVAKGR